MNPKYLSKKFLAVLLFTLFLSWGFPMDGCVLTSKAASIYTNGYFHYRVEDGSVTITEYFGSESVVEVPHMIAGNPVNTIGENAFANNKNVVTVSLPDTVTTILEGALGTGQNLTYRESTAQTAGADSFSSANTGNESQTDNTDNTSGEDNRKDSTDGAYTTQPQADDGDQKTGAATSTANTGMDAGKDTTDPTPKDSGISEVNTDPSINTGASDQNGKKETTNKKSDSRKNNVKFAELSGLTDKYGNFVTTDSDHHLVSVDPNGDETVLDDSKEYHIKKDKQGNTVITDQNGNDVNMTEDGKLSFTDDANNQVTVDLSSGNKTLMSEDGTTIGEEHLNTDFETDSNTENAKTSAEKKQIGKPAAAAFYIVGALIASAIAFALWQILRKKKS